MAGKQKPGDEPGFCYLRIRLASRQTYAPVVRFAGPLFATVYPLTLSAYKKRTKASFIGFLLERFRSCLILPERDNAIDDFFAFVFGELLYFFFSIHVFLLWFSVPW
jgi:hypothetical protein